MDQANKDVGLWQDVCNLKSGACTSSTVAFSRQISTTALETTDGSKSILLGTYNLWLKAVPSQADTLLVHRDCGHLPLQLGSRLRMAQYH